MAELLIALAILGVIATFTIPKVLQNQRDAKFKSIAKEAVAMVSAAYGAYRTQNSPTAGMSLASLTPYMNYVRLDTTATIDHINSGSSAGLPCGGSWGPCLRLHNGALLLYTANTTQTETFGGTGTTNAVAFDLDPDGKFDATTNSPGKPIQFILYFNGRIATRGTTLSGTVDNMGSLGAVPSWDPAWFSWD